MNGEQSRSVRYAVYILLAMFLAVFFAGCGPASAKTMSPMPKKSFSDVNQYKVAIAEKTTIDKILEVSGTAVLSNTKNLSFKNKGGYLKAVNVKLNDIVKEGDLLAELDTADLENELDRKRIELQRLELQYDKALMDAGLGSANAAELQSIKYDMESVNIDVAGINRKINEARLTAPFPGIVSDIAAYNLGNPVETYKPFVRVSKLDEFEINSLDLNPPPGAFAVSNTDPSGVVAGMKATMQYFRQNKKVEVPLTVIRVINADPGVKINGIGTPISNEAPPLHLRLKLTDPAAVENFGASQSGKIKINAGKLENVIIVPTGAVSGFGEDTIVKVIRNGRVTKRIVTTGYENKESKTIVITSGLREGESVIID